ncbi:hypothetical protein KFZ76_08365 [Methylovulum psychrotolerans]|uniref:hypothetical protein n=1 Tax=Methylovulum psychrotolerans TaxID=1704499 RepID=UPI001BFFCF2D|nr:hypothetical protein [Methylovulum psychrotolerans]MBT9097718.1 hypothetical protein [Methylovulum psychrotolerans]
MAKATIGLDSQCVTYIIDTMNNTNEPTGRLAPEYLALFRIYLYHAVFSITPTAKIECQEIKNAERKKLHISWINSQFVETQPINITQIETRITLLNNFHSGNNDCRILAEAEDAGLNTLISFDTDFVSRLRNKTVLSLMYPTEFWESLEIPCGANPVTVPYKTNPMAQEKWWAW